MNRFLAMFTILSTALAMGQTHSKDLITKIINVESDTVYVDSKSINPNFFEVYDSQKKRMDPDQYEVDFTKAKLWFNDPERYKKTSISVVYLPFPDFMTRYYTAFDKSLIVARATDESRLYSSQSNSRNKKQSHLMDCIQVEVCQGELP